jgi:hypothetical protein
VARGKSYGSLRKTVNQSLRTRIRAVETALNGLRVEIEAISSEERQAFVALSKDLQTDDRRAGMDIASSSLEEAAFALEMVIEKLAIARA